LDELQLRTQDSYNGRIDDKRIEADCMSGTLDFIDKPILVSSEERLRVALTPSALAGLLQYAQTPDSPQRPS
jgi:hypothetical protein